MPADIEYFRPRSVRELARVYRLIQSKRAHVAERNIGDPSYDVFNRAALHS